MRGHIEGQKERVGRFLVSKTLEDQACTPRHQPLVLSYLYGLMRGGSSSSGRCTFKVFGISKDGDVGRAEDSRTRGIDSTQGISATRARCVLGVCITRTDVESSTTAAWRCIHHALTV